MPTVETVLPNASLTIYLQKIESTFAALYEDSPSTLESIMPYALDFNDGLRACVEIDGFKNRCSDSYPEIEIDARAAPLNSWLKTTPGKKAPCFSLGMVMPSSHSGKLIPFGRKFL